jgi:hypothetical protein
MAQDRWVVQPRLLSISRMNWGNPGGGRVCLLPLQTHQRGAMLLIGEPGFDQAVGDERRAQDGNEQRDILPEQHAMQHAADERPGAAEG